MPTLTPMIDSHCHLDFADFGPELELILSRGRAAGVACFVTIGSGRGADSAPDALRLSESHADIAATVGIHPHDASIATDEAVAKIEALAAHPRVVAIGEVGLDHHYDNSPRDAQQGCFRSFVHVARRQRLPLVIHTRAAPEETLTVLREEGAREVGGVIHCFSEDEHFARRAMDMDFDISFSGIVTFKRSDALRAVARTVPLDKMLIETDAPYLAPMPHRGKRNEPAFLALTAAHLAATLGISVDSLRERTAENATRRFGLGRWGVSFGERTV